MARGSVYGRDGVGTQRPRLRPEATTPPNDVAPMKVNSTKKVPNLNADRLDDREASSFANGVGGVATNADKLDGKDSSEFAPAYKRTVVVSPIGTDASNGTALLKALSRITDASASRPYLLYIEPGTYDLSTGSLAMKEHVDIQGAGEGKTLITSSVSDSDSCTTATVRGANNAELRFLTVRNTGTGRFCHATAIRNDGASPGLTHVRAESTGGGGLHRGVVNFNNSNPAMTNVTATASGGSSTNEAVYNDSSSPTMTNVTATASDTVDSFSANYGVVNFNNSNPTMTNVTATACGGNVTYGVLNVASSSPTISHSRLQGAGGSGVNGALSQQGGAAKVALTQLVGSVGASSGSLYCFNNYDQNLWARKCP